MQITIALEAKPPSYKGLVSSNVDLPQAYKVRQEHVFQSCGSDLAEKSKASDLYLLQNRTHVVDVDGLISR